MKKPTEFREYEVNIVSHAYQRAFTEVGGEITRYAIKEIHKVPQLCNYCTMVLEDMETGEISYCRISALIKGKDDDKLKLYIEEIPKSEYIDMIYNTKRYNETDSITEEAKNEKYSWYIPIYPMEIRIGSIYGSYYRNSFYIFSLDGGISYGGEFRVELNRSYDGTFNKFFYFRDEQYFTFDTNYMNHPLLSILTLDPAIVNSWNFDLYSEETPGRVFKGSIPWNRKNGDLYMMISSEEVKKRLGKIPDIYYSIEDLMQKNLVLPENGYIARVACINRNESNTEYLRKIPVGNFIFVVKFPNQ